MRRGPGRGPSRLPDAEDRGEMSLTKRAGEYLKEVRAETAKVSWPGRKEIQANTIVVILAVAILSLFIYVIDRIYLFALNLLLSRPAS